MSAQPPPKTILVVEDDDTNRKLVRVILGGRGYRIQEAEGVRQAFELLGKETPDLMLVDIRLGDGSGLDVIRRVRSNPAFDAVPVVAITAQAMKGDEDRFLAAGFDGYLSKPVNTRRLPEMVERFLREGRRAGHA